MTGIINRMEETLAGMYKDIERLKDLMKGTP
jgi:hypothetical protein